MSTQTPLPTCGPRSVSPSGSSSARSLADQEFKQQQNCPGSVPPQQPAQRPVTPSSSPGPSIHALCSGSPGASPAHSPLPPPHGPPPALALAQLSVDAAAGTGAPTSRSRPASRSRTSTASSPLAHVSMAAAPAIAIDHSHKVSTAGLEKYRDHQQDFVLIHVDRTLARLSRLLATVVESHEAQSMLQPLLRRNILLAQFSLAVLKSAPARPLQSFSSRHHWQQPHHHHHHHHHHHRDPDAALLTMQPPYTAAQARPGLQRTHLSAPAILLTTPSDKSDLQDPPKETDLMDGKPDEVWNLAEDLAAIASLLCDLANPRNITVSLDCPNVILPFRGPHLLSSRHLILVAGYCLGIIADHGHVAISLHWPTGCGAEAAMRVGEHKSPDGIQGADIGSLAGTQEMDAKNQRPIVSIRASPVLPHYQQHVPTVADLPTPFVSSVRMRCRVNQPGSQHPSPGAAPDLPQANPPAARSCTSTTAPASSPSPPGSPDTAQTSPIDIPSLLNTTHDAIARPSSPTSLGSSGLATTSTTTSDLHYSLTIEIQLPLTPVTRSVGTQPHSLHTSSDLKYPLDDPPTPASPKLPAGTHSAPHPSTHHTDLRTELETRTDILDAFASSLNGHPIGCFPSAAVLHSLHTLGVIPHPMRNVSHFPRLSVVHLPSHLLQHLVTALRQLPRQESIGVLAILDSDDQVVDVFEWLEAAAASAEPRLDRDRQHTHLDGPHNLVLHIAPNPPCTLLLLESLIALNATLHLVRGVRGATSAGTGAKPAMDGARTAAAAAKSGAARSASATTSGVSHWGSPMAGPELLSPTVSAIAEWERTMDMLAEACGGGGDVDDGSTGSTSLGRAKDDPTPPVVPPPRPKPAFSSSSNSVVAGSSSRTLSPLPQYPATSPPTPAPVRQYAKLDPGHRPSALPLPAEPTTRHGRLTLSSIPESIATLGSKLLSPYVHVDDTRLFPSPPASALADTAASSFTSDAQRLWSPLVPMRSLTTAPPGMHQGGGTGQLPVVPLDVQVVGRSGTGRRQSLLRRKSDESLRGLFPLVRVLVVEDDPIATRILSIFLARRSIDHVTATTGPQAMHHFTRSDPYHVVLMNLGLAQEPGKDAMDGLECTRAMRQFELARGGADAGTRRIMPPAVIIALTADTSADTHRAALAAGCDDVAVKPFRLKWIEDKLVEVAALMGLVQPAMAMRELAAGVAEEQGRVGEGEVPEEQQKQRERARTWAEQVKRDVAAGAGVGAGEQASQTTIPRQRSVSAGVQVAGGQVHVRDDALWRPRLIVDGPAARARTSSDLGSLRVCVEEDKQQQAQAPSTGDQVGSLAPSSSASSVEE